MEKTRTTRLGKFTSIRQLLSRYQPGKSKQVTREFQLYGLELADELDDWEHRSLYIRLAKTLPRHLLEKARSFVRDAENAKSKARLFMWKLKELRKNEK